MELKSCQCCKCYVNANGKQLALLSRLKQIAFVVIQCVTEVNADRYLCHV